MRKRYTEGLTIGGDQDARTTKELPSGNREGTSGSEGQGTQGWRGKAKAGATAAQLKIGGNLTNGEARARDEETVDCQDQQGVRAYGRQTQKKCIDHGVGVPQGNREGASGSEGQGWRGKAKAGTTAAQLKIGGNLKERHFADSDDLCRRLSEDQGGACLLAFSRGKDALGAWLQLRKYFTRVVPFFRYLIPGGPLSFEEASLRYYEDVFGVQIARIPHPSMPRMLANLVFQAPENCALVESMALPQWEYQEGNDMLRWRSGLLEMGGYVANGTRAVDSPQRWQSVKVHGACNHARREFLAVFDWRLDRVVAEIADAGVKLPVDYKLWGRTFDGIDARFLGPLREHFPDDYERVLHWFPLADLELFRAQMRKGPAHHA